MNAVTVENVSKRFRLYHERNQSLKASLLRRRRADYEEFWALRDVSLEIPTGSTYGLIGANGSGKSTLLKCMARILRPDQGTVSTVGKVSALLELGAGFHPELSGRENVYLNASILGLSSREVKRRFDEIVEFAGLTRFIDTPVKNYSSGMYVRLGFSVAINVDPDVLLVDEVLAVGDEEFQRRCSERFAELRASGRTIVIVSHALDSVRNLCDHVAWLEGGDVKDVGTAGRIVDEYIDASHEARHGESETEARWGEGGATIERFEILDRDGRPTRRVRTGEPVTFRFHVKSASAVDGPVLSIAISRIDGVRVSEPNTRDYGYKVDKLDGGGHFDLAVDRLLLLPGTYDLSASLFDKTCVKELDARQRALRFDVEPGSPREPSTGLVSLGGDWRFSET